MARDRIHSLQILRFLAAFLVLVGHSQHEFVELLGGSSNWFQRFIPFDWGLGVDIFFIISGFVMYYLARDQFGQDGAAANFLRRRIIRVVPLYWLFTSLALVVALRTGRMGGGEPFYLPNVITSYLFIPGPRCGEYCFPLFTLGWTLNYEMLFYAIFAFALCFGKRIGVPLIFAIILGLMLMGQLVPPSLAMLHFWGYPIIGEFLIGIAVAALYAGGFRMARGPAIALVLLGFVLATISYQLTAYEILWRLVTGGIPAAMIVLAAVTGLEPPAKEARRPMIAFLVAGGDASYALYLSHPFMIKIATAVSGRLHLMLISPWIFMALAIFLALMGAFLVHYLLEKPLLRILSGLWKGQPKRRAGSDAAPKDMLEDGETMNSALPRSETGYSL